MKKALEKTKSLDKKHTDAEMWFTNLPLEPVGISGIAKYAMACHPEKKISLIRGPNRGFLATAGVHKNHPFLYYRN